MRCVDAEGIQELIVLLSFYRSLAVLVVAPVSNLSKALAFHAVSQGGLLHGGTPDIFSGVVADAWVRRGRRWGPVHPRQVKHELE